MCTMDIITENMSNMNMCSEVDVMDFLCNGLQNTRISYINTTDIDEYQELEQAFHMKNMGIEILNKTADRYSRYLHEIEVWEIGDISCLYLKEYVTLFITESVKERTNENIIRQSQLMKYIDSEIMKLLNTMQ